MTDQEFNTFFSEFLWGTFWYITIVMYVVQLAAAIHDLNSRHGVIGPIKSKKEFLFRINPLWFVLGIIRKLDNLENKDKETK